MEYVDREAIQSLGLDMMRLSNTWPGASSVWRYMTCALHYPIHTVVIGQCPYEDHLLPHLGAAFSQAEYTRDTPTTSMFNLHFTELGDSPRDFIRSTWKLLLQGYMFVNADYVPSSLGGGDRGISCVLRVNRTAEFIFYCVVNLRRFPEKLTILCVGSLALTCASDLSRRLRSLGVNVNQLGCKQPSALNRTTKYRDHIGRKENYMFCGGKTLELFTLMIMRHSLVFSAKEKDILSLVSSNMSSNPISPMTKTSLNNIAGDINTIYGALEGISRSNSSDEMSHREKELVVQLMLLTKSVAELTNVLLADAYTYKVIVEGQTSQIPVASREQYMPHLLDSGSEARSIGVSEMTSNADESVSGEDSDVFIDALFSSPLSKNKSSSKSVKKDKNRVSTTKSSSKMHVQLKSDTTTPLPSLRGLSPKSSNKVEQDVEDLVTNLDSLFASELAPRGSPDRSRLTRRHKKK